MAETRTNLGASVRAKLLNQARASGQPFDLILVRFALERLLYRLSISGHAERFVLKGAMLLTLWFDDPARPTRDLDLLGFGDPDPDAMQATFREILSIEVDDGILFNADTLRVNRIREAFDYGGVRLRAVADVGRARVPAAIDVGFGDALEPGAELLDYPTSRSARTQAKRLCPRDGDRREVSGDGVARPRQFTNEGFLRHLAFGEELPFQR